jgi:hypothetical protein
MVPAFKNSIFTMIISFFFLFTHHTPHPTQYINHPLSQPSVFTLIIHCLPLHAHLCPLPLIPTPESTQQNGGGTVVWGMGMELVGEK